MKHRNLWGGIAVAALVFANLVNQLLLETPSAVAENERPGQVVRAVEIPQWLVHELGLQATDDSGAISKRNFFLQYDPQVDAIAAADIEPPPVVQPVAVAAREYATVQPRSHFDVLAINTDGKNSSAMVRFQGKSQLVFIGDVVFENYRVKDITTETVYFDLLP